MPGIMIKIPQLVRIVIKRVLCILIVLTLLLPIVLGSGRVSLATHDYRTWGLDSVVSFVNQGRVDTVELYVHPIDIKQSVFVVRYGGQFDLALGFDNGGCFKQRQDISRNMFTSIEMPSTCDQFSDVYRVWSRAISD